MRAGQVHLLKPFLERLVSMNPHCRVIQGGGAEARHDTIARFAKDVGGAPDDLRVFRLERRQQFVEAILDCSFEFDIRRNRVPESGLAIPAPCGHRMNLTRVPAPQRKALQDLLGLLAVTQAAAQGPTYPDETQPALALLRCPWSW